MAQFTPVGTFHINPESVETVKLLANGLLSFTFSDKQSLTVDATAAADPNDLSEIQQTFESLGGVSLVLLGTRLVNPAHIDLLSDYAGGTLITFSSGNAFSVPLTQVQVKNAIDERTNGKIVNKVETFSLSLSDTISTGSGDFTAAFTASNLYSGLLPNGIGFSAGEITGFEAGRWLIIPGVTYTSSVANSLPRLRTVIDDLDEVGTLRPYYPVANENVYGSYAFVKNLTSASRIKLIYGDNNPASSSFVIRCSFAKLADQAAVISNPNNALTIGGIVVTINGVPLVI